MTPALDALVELNQGGRLLDRRALESLPEPAEPPRDLADQLRDALTASELGVPGKGAELSALLDVVLEGACGLREGWTKGSLVGEADAEKLLDGTVLKPRRVLALGGETSLAVFVTPTERIGLHKGRRVVAQVVEYLRRRKVQLGLLTNGREWRLVFADPDNLAWLEWAADRWLEGDTLAPLLTLLRWVLSPLTLAPAEGGGPCRLLAAIRQTRRGQAQLSKELGERVRAAVELLLRARRSVLDPTWDEAASKSVYDAACHFVMRLVVVLFAEARELLPVDSSVYHQAYGLRGLLESLGKIGGERRSGRISAWPRLLALFRLLHTGSFHPQLIVTAYGGDLFRAGDPGGDAIQRALSLIEATASPPDDDIVYRLLVLLTRTTERVREGSAFRTVAAPVDFTELTSEYIGILYEGLLDYELHRAGSEPIVFLGLGDQPALPLDRLEGMSDKQLATLVEKAKVHGAAAAEGEEEGDEEGEGEEGAPEEPEGEAAEDATEVPVAVDELSVDDGRAEAMKRALAWAERAALAGKLVKAPRGKKGRDDPAWKADIAAAAKQLIAELKLPGELYLVRWGGTRKGAGTFYTRPQLTLPTVRRTLEPLLAGPEGKIRSPEELLALKVCDPAMGSGSFLVATLRVLTEAVVRSLHEHGRVTRVGDRVHLACELLPEGDRDQGEERIDAIVRRAVVEHCVYGVDLDPLAVELARVSLWVETLDPRLPFTFLDHKLRCGDALVGTWLDRFRDYPLLAWWRQSPDEKWRGVTHEGDVWAKALKEKRKAMVEEQVELLTGQKNWLAGSVSDDELRSATERVRRLYRELRAVPASQPDKRAEIWRTRVVTDPALARVREAFDTWCALWFWPLDRLDDAPGPAGLPAPSAAAQEIVRELREQRRFFHWELEFPDVFTEIGAGFDAIVANPPWEVRKPSSKEFFSDRDPLYRSYGKQEALVWQREQFAKDAAFELRWLDHVGAFKDAGNFVRNAGEPYGDADDGQGRPLVGLVPRKADDSHKMHKRWAIERAKKTGLSDPEHPFRHQGSADLNSYKLFVEQAHALLKRGGQFGLITPSGLYTDKGSVDLRRLLLERCSWRWLYGFENRNKVFDIDGRFKFAIAIARKGDRTKELCAAFMRQEIEDWAETKGALAYPAERIRAFSPQSLSVLEIRSLRDLEVLTQMRACAHALGDDGPGTWGVNYKREFHSTDDSKNIPPLDKWLQAGFYSDVYLHLRNGSGDIALPVLSGRIIDQFNFAASSWISGKGRTSVWQPIAADREAFRPEFLMAADYFRSSIKRFGFPKMALMEITSATNERTCISALVPDWPGIHKTPFMAASDGDFVKTASLTAIFNSFCFDYVARLSVGGLSLSWFLLQQMPLPAPSEAANGLAEIALRLNGNHVVMAPYWCGQLSVGRASIGWRQSWSITPSARLWSRVKLDALVAALYGLSRADLRWILRDCDHPKGHLSDNAFCRGLDAKGFWRVDKDQDPELRHTVLTLVAFDALEKLITEHGGDRDAGIKAFSALNDGEGWMLPETLCLADHGLGHDERAAVPQPVASRLGPRFLDWQLAQTPEESWAECERHARAILGDEEFERRFAKPTTEPPRPLTDPQPIGATSPRRSPAPEPTPTATSPQMALFAPRPTAAPAPPPLEPLPMTISQIRLLNFRNWTDAHWEKGIPLAPVTLILGRNSAGKTSILQPLRMLKQTIGGTDRATQLRLSVKKDGVDLGTYAEVVNGHDEKREMGVGIDLAEQGISVDVRFRQIDQIPVIESLAYRIRGEKVEVTRTQNAYQLSSPRFRLPNWDGARDVHEPKKAYTPDRAVYFSGQALTDLGALGTQLEAAIKCISEAFESIYYLGPLRSPPERDFAWSQEELSQLGTTGSLTPQVLINSEIRKSKSSLRMADVSKWLRHLDLADGIELTRVGKTSYQIDVLRGTNRSNIVDVGFGVSQVLPVIVLLHFVPEGSVILCEDPEAHLHPMAQTGLADMFVQVAKERKLQILLETHSEHLFRRLQYLIADGAIRNDQCALYYVERDEPAAKLTTLETDEFGRMKNWPEDFFGDAIGEVERQTAKVFARMKEKKLHG